MKSIFKYLYLILLLQLVACNKEPKIETNVFGTGVKDVTVSTAYAVGNVVLDYGSILEVGVCWSNNELPLISDNKIISSIIGDKFESKIEGLVATTTYHVRTYTKTDKGLYYGNDIAFTTLNLPSASAIAFNSSIQYESVIDNEGTSYKTVVIGTQTWMAENLRTKHYNNGDLIDNSMMCSYLNNESYVPVFGRLYLYYTTEDPRGICPVGWHLPSTEEWETLISNVGYDSTNLKESGTEHWLYSGNGNNSTGFSLVPGGYCSNPTNSYFDLMGQSSFCWTSSAALSSDQKMICSTFNYYSFTNFEVNKSSALSIRCIKD